MRESGLLATCLPIITPAVVVVVVVVSQETTLHYNLIEEKTAVWKCFDYPKW